MEAALRWRMRVARAASLHWESIVHAGHTISNPLLAVHKEGLRDCLDQEVDDGMYSHFSTLVCA